MTTRQDAALTGVGRRLFAGGVLATSCVLAGTSVAVAVPTADQSPAAPRAASPEKKKTRGCGRRSMTLGKSTLTLRHPGPNLRTRVKIKIRPGKRLRYCVRVNYLRRHRPVPRRTRGIVVVMHEGRRIARARHRGRRSWAVRVRRLPTLVTTHTKTPRNASWQTTRPDRIYVRQSQAGGVSQF